MTTDTCVPISRLAESVVTASEEAEAAGMMHYIVGHVGDGNFHIAYLVDPNIPGERETAERLNEALVMRVLAMDGTCSGEHGIGLHKMDFLVSEAGSGAIDMMRTRQARARPEEHHEPGQDLRALSAARNAARRVSTSSRSSSWREGIQMSSLGVATMRLTNSGLSPALR